MSDRWDPLALPSQDGRTIVVTGGNAGIGYFTAEQLARAGARVVLAARSPERARTAMAAIRRQVPDAALDTVALDLTALASVARAADELRTLRPLHALVNNAGLVVSPRRRETTADGLELLTGGNFFGHFALTALLWPALAEDARVVGLGSMSTRMSRLDPGDLQSVRRYAPFRAYAMSKHLVHGFAFELDRRLRATGSGRASLLAHPGFAVTGLAARRPGVTDLPAGKRATERVLFSLVGQGKDSGAWPVVRAVADPDAESGTFYGPSRVLAGHPVPLAPVVSSASPVFGAQLWSLAERLTGVRFEV
ncbi:MAG: SDR family NAD(P)-dependent oxidoreductase [Microbacteriaceae bacterium]|nr:SDR family NAD(P)-dependent oxidoreductase [Microbacteriaceae bacterium]